MSGSDADEQTDAGAGETTTTVLVAFFANLAIAVAKTIVALATGSASMLAESAHSWADTGNQVLLFIADRRSRKPPDDGHPLGYGREAYVWSLVAAFGLFTAGAVVSVWEGVSKLLAEETGEVSYTWAYVVLGLAFVFEGVSFAQAFRQTRREARPLDRHVLEHAFETSDPTLRAVFAEEGGGVFLHQVTGNPVYDAMGSIVVGLLLGVVAVVLINQNRRFLTGQESDPELRRVAIDRVKALPGVARVTYLRLEYVGPRQVFLTARVDLEGEPRETTIAQVLRDLEERLTHERYVRAAVLSLATPDEPDL